MSHKFIELNIMSDKLIELMQYVASLLALLYCNSLITDDADQTCSARILLFLNLFLYTLSYFSIFKVRNNINIRAAKRVETCKKRKKQKKKGKSRRGSAS